MTEKRLISFRVLQQQCVDKDMKSDCYRLNKFPQWIVDKCSEKTCPVFKRLQKAPETERNSQ